MNESQLREGLTFDDVLLVPGASEVLPSNVNLQTRLTQEISLNSPLLSAAMDTVTEHATAICMAQNGGLGAIHKNMSVVSQAAEVGKVKRSESGMIVSGAKASRFTPLLISANKSQSALSPIT